MSFVFVHASVWAELTRNLDILLSKQQLNSGFRLDLIIRLS